MPEHRWRKRATVQPLKHSGLSARLAGGVVADDLVVERRAAQHHVLQSVSPAHADLVHDR